DRPAGPIPARRGCGDGDAGAGRAREGVARETIAMGIYATKSKWQQALGPVVGWCLRHRVPPDVFTYGAPLLCAVAGLALWAAGPNGAWLWLVPPLVLLRLLFNLLDGQIARASGLADGWGEVKNEFGDRIADAVVYLGLMAGGYADARLGALALV